jgi:hypothetical protein
MQPNEIPDGYMQDAQGRLVPVSMVKEIDKLRDELVKKLVECARAQAAALAAFKASALSEIQAFVDLSASQYGRELGGTKGNVQLVSYDGRFRVDRCIADSLDFDERLQVAKELIDECLQEWSSDSRPELKLLVNDAFQVDRKGNVNTKRILSLRKFEIEDARWKQAMQAINDSLTVSGSRTYLRIYERSADGEQYRQLPLDLASV